MLLHLLYNDHKFIDYIVEYFEAANPGQNVFTAWGKQLNAGSENADKVTLVNKNDFSQEPVLRKEYTGIVAHGLDAERALFLQQVDPKIPVAWLIFGQEYYSIIRGVRNSLLEKDTKLLNNHLEWKKWPLRHLLKKSFSKFRGSQCHDLLCRMTRGYPSNDRVVRAAIERADFVGCPYVEEFEYIQSKFNLTGKSIDFCYYNLEDTATGCLDETITGDNVLVGNSSSVTNNHLEVIDVLARHRSEFEKVSIPLGYGEANYREAIVSAGRERLGNQFDPWTEFIDRSEYVRRALKCKVAIMNHRRQQGVGTILTLLWIGSKLFLNPQSTVYTFLKRFGVTVYSVQDLIDNRLDSPFERLTAEEMENNRALLRQQFNKEKIIENTYRLVESVYRQSNKSNFSETVAT